jgi:hypothetical protein
MAGFLLKCSRERSSRVWNSLRWSKMCKLGWVCVSRPYISWHRRLLWILKLAPLYLPHDKCVLLEICWIPFFYSCACATSALYLYLYSRQDYTLLENTAVSYKSRQFITLCTRRRCQKAHVLLTHKKQKCNWYGSIRKKNEIIFLNILMKFYY